MLIIEVNYLTQEYQLGQLQSLKTTLLNQWRRLTGHSQLKSALHSRRWAKSLSWSSKTRLLVLFAKTRSATIMRIGVCPH
jgi:hypothetical protein